MKAARYLAKPVDAEGTRILELALAEYPEGGFVLHVLGFEDDGTERRPSAEPDDSAATGEARGDSERLGSLQ